MPLLSISLLMYLCTSLHAPVSDGAKVKFSHFIALGMGSLRIAKVTYLYEKIIRIERHVIVYISESIYEYEKLKIPYLLLNTGNQNFLVMGFLTL